MAMLQRTERTRLPALEQGSRRLRLGAVSTSDLLPSVAFLFNAQAHQVLHGITIAEELAAGWQTRVDILCSTAAAIEIARAAVTPGNLSRMQFELVGSALIRRLAGRRDAVPPKLLTLLGLRRRLNQYDAIALPERTSIVLRDFGVRRPRFIHVDHGAGDGAAGFDERIARFDFALMAGEKQRRRLLAQGLIREGASAIVGYPKFEAADRLRERSWSPFAERRPVVLYNPHFSEQLGSWARHGKRIVAEIAASGRYNLLVAPHVRLGDSRRGRAAAEAIFGAYRDLPGVHVDLGSQRSIDMTYTSMADIYLGDVSSQVYEYLRRPRPCLFVNSDGRAWHGDPNHDHWRFGPVLDDAAAIVAALDEARERHADYAPIQATAFVDTFDLHPGEGDSVRAAAAIAGFLDLRPRER